MVAILLDMRDSLEPDTVLLADLTSDASNLRVTIAAKSAWVNIPSMPQCKHKPNLSAYLYKYRNFVQRFFSELKHSRAIATRYNKRDYNYLGSGQRASMRI